MERSAPAAAERMPVQLRHAARYAASVVPCCVASRVLRALLRRVAIANQVFPLISKRSFRHHRSFA